MNVLKAVRPSAEYEVNCIAASYLRKQVARDDIPDAMAAAITRRAGSCDARDAPRLTARGPLWSSDGDGLRASVGLMVYRIAGPAPQEPLHAGIRNA